MHEVVTTKEVVTHWNDVVKRAGRSKENHHERKRENDSPVVGFHEYVDDSHVRAPDKLATQPQQQQPLPPFMELILVLRPWR